MLDKEKIESAYTLLAQAFGEENELRMCIEEMSELTKELCKYIRYLNAPDINEEEKTKLLEKVKNNIIEETADVLLCTGQVKKMFGSEQVEKMMMYKIERSKKQAEDYLAKQNLGENNG